jgi:hypothetical protein
LLLLDCKNEKPLVYPKVYPDQLLYPTAVNLKEDIEGKFYDWWEIYCIKKTEVRDTYEARKFSNRMMYVLTG